MLRFQNLLCFMIFFVIVIFFNVVLVYVKIKFVLLQIGDLISVGDVEFYIVKIVFIFVVDLEKECVKIEKFRYFFEKVNVFFKCVCLVFMDYEFYMKVKVGSFF